MTKYLIGVCVCQIYDGTMNKNAVMFFLGLSHVLL